LFEIIAAWSFTKMGLLEPTAAAAEAMALFHGIQFCKNLGLHSLIVEGDAIVVISALHSQD
jgi:ribonuclease HI